MKFNKNLLACVLSVLLIVSYNSSNVYANKYTYIKSSSENAYVLQVIDGDAIKVKLNNGNIALIKLVGVDTKAYDGAYEYLINLLTGQNVLLVKDSGVPTNSDNWNYMQVYHNGINLSSDLISKGLGQVNTKHSKSNTYTSLINSENNAKNQNLAIWQTDGTNSYTDVKVNINVASSSTLTSSLKGINSTLAENIINYRKYNPFNNIKELKFVPGMTQNIYDKNKTSVGVYTNINSANQEELESLGLSSETAKNIINQVSRQNFYNLSDLRDKGYINTNTYDAINNFAGTSSKQNIDVTYKTFVANINGTYKTYINDTDFPSSVLNTLSSYVYSNGYTFKNMGEIVSIVPAFNTTDINKYEDNINFVTYVPNASLNELRSILTSSEYDKIRAQNSLSDAKLQSLLGPSRYEKLKGVLTVALGTPSYVNLNTATKAQLTEIGASENTATSIVNKSGKMKTSKDIPADITSINNKVTLITNINKADKNALLSLNNGMTSYLAEKITSQTYDAPFGTMDEVKDFFNKYNASDVFGKIQSFICIR